MNALENAIANALVAQGNLQEANKAYLEFIKANFLIPIEKNTIEDEPTVLFLENKGQYFLPVFTTYQHLQDWANEIEDKIQILRLSGVDLLKGIGEHVTLCLNIGTPFYKEFNPSEIARLRSMILKLFSKEHLA